MEFNITYPQHSFSKQFLTVLSRWHGSEIKRIELLIYSCYTHNEHPLVITSTITDYSYNKAKSDLPKLYEEVETSLPL